MKDLTGQRFGRLTAIRPTTQRKGSCIVWECKCDCGNLKLVKSSDLVSGNTRSCGCWQKDSSRENGKRASRDIAGQRFGMLTAIRPTEKRLWKATVWECKCDCGNTTFVSLGSLNGGNTRSCGCLCKASREQIGVYTIKDLTGQRFGRLIAIRPTDERKNGSVVWECACDCGNTVFVSSASLKHGYRKSCGCLREKKTFEPETTRSVCSEENGKRNTRIRDLTGQRFGRLVARNLTGRRKGASLEWACECDCGNTVYVASNSLVKGNTRSCGCLRKENAAKIGLMSTKTMDLTGQRSGRLMAVRPTEERKNGSVVWECKCDCGNTVFVQANQLSSNQVLSCGCLQKDRIGHIGKQRAVDITGQRFGRLTAVRPTEERKKGLVVWECRCDCGNNVFVNGVNLRHGKTRSCGCLRKKIILEPGSN